VNCANFSPQTRIFTYYIYTTQDGGGTWKATSYPGNALYFFSADTGWALSQKIQRTSDGGTTWTAVSNVSWGAQVDFISEQIGWAIATSGNEVALVKTTDGGGHWLMLTPAVGP
jgi:photosystem II stability/assembly factor-like uncharacterized protein